jgi:hypothetical protein
LQLIDAYSGIYEDSSEQDEEIARKELLEARAKYMLRNNVVEVVMTANPILKAVHDGTDASAVERQVARSPTDFKHDELMDFSSDLLPYVERRDEAAISVAKHASNMSHLRDAMSKVQGETLRVSRKNVTLAAQVFELADEMKRKKSGRPDDPLVQEEIEKLERAVKTSGQRWRVIKGVASGVVVGSGINWARDDALCEIVLDPEDEV